MCGVSLPVAAETPAPAPAAQPVPPPMPPVAAPAAAPVPAAPVPAAPVAAPVPAAPASAWTPESGVYPKAPLGGRLLAVIADSIIGAALLPAGVLLFMSASTRGEFSVLGAILIGVGALWQLAYALGRDSFGGAGWGKRLAGLVVISSETGMPAKAGAAMVRQFVLYALNVIPAIGSLIEPVMVLIDKDGKRLGDKVAKTQVVRSADASARGVAVTAGKGLAIGVLVGALTVTLIGSAAGGLAFAGAVNGELTGSDNIGVTPPEAAETPGAPEEGAQPSADAEPAPAEEPSGPAVNAETAVDAVGNLLNSLKENDVDQARKHATRGFQEEAEWFFYPAGGALIQFEVADVFQDQAIWVVVVKEDWNSGPQESRYFVIEEDNVARVDGIDFDE